MKNQIIIIGAGLAGSEAAYQIAKRGIKVLLYEMRPEKFTPAHNSSYFAELVCSNSLGSMNFGTPSGLLKEELKRIDSLLIKGAEKFRVPGGQTLCVDRKKFAEWVTYQIGLNKNIEIKRKEVKEIPSSEIVIIASGPLTSDNLLQNLMKFTGKENLYFYDATSPIVLAESIDYTKVFRASRYNKGSPDYLNASLSEEKYENFYQALIKAEVVELHPFEKNNFFESCLPIEEMARRGKNTLLFGPLRPVGIINPQTGKRPYAVVQLRQDDLAVEHYQLVGFQTRLKWKEQERIFRMIPGLEKAEFVRFGVMHRNTYINASSILNNFFQTKKRKSLFIIGQLSGVEGYVESIASGLIAGINVSRLVQGKKLLPFPQEAALGTLGNYISKANSENFQPVKFTFGLLPSLSPPVRGKRKRRFILAQRALRTLEIWIKKNDILR
ncbi:MAG: methylenetetrahydrofolate--tRNA-(uracil(54)-C(5))-methyltransferase (FADH(2)-oxidizing) TrmFO [Candidatus Aminicenantia bacterium]